MLHSRGVPMLTGFVSEASISAHNPATVSLT